MKVSIFSTQNYDRKFLELANQSAGHRLVFHESRLLPDTASLAAASDGGYVKAAAHIPKEECLALSA